MKYRVVKSKRNTLCLTINKKGEVIVRAPLTASKRQIIQFVQKHERWIAVHLAKRKPQRVLNLDDHQPLVLFGERYEIVEGRSKITGGTVQLPKANRESALLRILKVLAKEKLQPIVEGIAKKYAYKYSGVRISTARSRWGSCNKNGMLAFTCFLAFVDPMLVTYVVVHELCHTRHFNHSKNFWREVEKILPDWRKLRAGLKQEESCLEFLRSSEA